MEIIDPRIDPRLVPGGSRAIVIAEHQEEFRNIPAIVTPSSVVISRWEPTDEERRRIANGEDLFLTIWGTPIRPVLLTVGPIDWNGL